MPEASISRNTLKVTGILLVVAAVLAAVSLAADVVLLTFLASLFSLGITGLAEWVAGRTPLSRRWSLAIVLLSLVGLAGLAALLIIPQLIDQTGQLLDQIPGLVHALETRIRSSQVGERLLSRALETDMSKRMASGYFSKAVGAVTNSLAMFANFVFVLVMTIFILVEPSTYRNAFVRLFPDRGQARVEAIAAQLARTMRMWLLGRLFNMLVIAVLTGIGLLALGIPLALTLAVFAGLLAFIPNIGPVVALILALLVALPQGLSKQLLVLALYFGVQFLESYVLTPIVQRKAISLPAAALLFSQLLFGVLFGILGVLLATPLTACILVLVRMVYMEDILGRRGTATPDGNGA